jgi:nitrate/nitrite transport system permease protein
MTLHDDPAVTSAVAVDVPVDATAPTGLEPLTTVQPAERRAPEPPGLPRGHSRIAGAATSVGWALVGFAVFVALWGFGASRTTNLPTPLPSPAETFTEIREMLSDPFAPSTPEGTGIFTLLWTSLQRVFRGFGLAAVVGLPLGMLMGTSRRAWMAANPIVQVLRPVSPLAWFPIWLAAFQDAPKAAVWVIFITALWPIVLNTAAGAATVPADQRNVARVFRFGRVAYLRHVLIPNTLPSAVTGLRLSMGISWMVIVAVEMLSGSTGIGDSIWEWYNGLNLPKITAGIIFIGLLGLALDALFLRLSRAVAIEEAHS